MDARTRRQKRFRGPDAQKPPTSENPSVRNRDTEAAWFGDRRGERGGAEREGENFRGERGLGHEEKNRKTSGRVAWLRAS